MTALQNQSLTLHIYGNASEIRKTYHPVEDYTYTVYHAGRDPKKSLGFIEKPFDLNPYSFGVRKADQEWLNFLNFYIYKLHQSGKMRELYQKWFNAEPARVSPNW